MNLLTEIKPIGPVLGRWLVLGIIGLLVVFGGICHFIAFIADWTEDKLREVETWLNKLG